MELLIAVISGSALAALINQIGEFFRERKKHKDDNADTESDDIKMLKKALRYVLLDRIRYVGQTYITAGTIDFDDRRILNEMHDVYHSGLGGNGDLDILMGEVNKLPLKKVC